MSHICDTCGAGATTARRLLDHRRKHQLVASVSIEGVSQNLERFSEQEVWVCPVQACPFTSLNIGSLRNHVKTHRAATPDAPSPSVSLCRSSLPSSQSSDPLLPPLQNASESEHHEVAAQQDSSPVQQLARNTRRRRSRSQSSSDDSSMPNTFVGRKVGTRREITLRGAELGIPSQGGRVKSRDSGQGSPLARCWPPLARCSASGAKA